MAQRNSEYARVDGDTYVTPRWVYEAIYAVEDFGEHFDCAPTAAQCDFLQFATVHGSNIVTNPPFKQAYDFVTHALYLTLPHRGKVAMLLPHAWDTAKTRRELFEQATAPFKAKYTLTKRIRWENLEQKKNGPSTNHAWFVWDWKYEGKPFLAYLPKLESLSGEAA